MAEVTVRFQGPIQMGNRGFTLVELLVVIAIISLLAALLFPVFSQARQSANLSSAANRLRQVGIATVMYTDDFDGVICPYFVGYDAVNHVYVDPQRYWPQLVTGYVQGVASAHGYRGQMIDTDLPAVWFDPVVHLKPQASGDYGYITSWGISDAVVDWAGPAGRMPTHLPMAMVQVADTAGTYLLVSTRDFFFSGMYPGDALALAPTSSYGGANAKDSTAGHYFGSDDFSNVPATGRGPVFFCDGHARSQLATQTSTHEAGWEPNGSSLWR